MTCQSPPRVSARRWPGRANGTPERRRPPRLVRARRTVCTIIANRCGLVDAANPCRCARQIQSGLEAGILDRDDLQFATHPRTGSGRIETGTIQRAAEQLDLVLGDERGVPLGPHVRRAARGVGTRSGRLPRPARVIDPEQILGELLALDPALRRERYYGERAIFYNPHGAAPLGVIFASVKDRDGPNDRTAALSRAGVYRLAFGLTRPTFARLFGAVPARPPKGEAVALPGYDLTRLGELAPHPVYAWMSWVQVLSPTAARFASLKPLLAESLELARDRWARRTSA